MPQISRRPGLRPTRPWIEHQRQAYGRAVGSRRPCAGAGHAPTSEFLSETQKLDCGATFTCYGRNYTPRAVCINIGFGVLEAEPTMSAEAHQRLRATNRAAYSYRAPSAEVINFVFGTTDAKVTATPEFSTVDLSW
jgi:hypothetical protein